MQLSFFEPEVVKKPVQEFSEWGTFRDSLRAPVHGWFTYPAGFSYKAVEHSLKEAGVKTGRGVVYDPFMGSGTTNLVAKTLGLNSIGVEAHPFVFRITQSKMNWEIDFEEVRNAVQQIEKVIFSKKEPAVRQSSDCRTNIKRTLSATKNSGQNPPNTHPIVRRLWIAIENARAGQTTKNRQSSQPEHYPFSFQLPC